MIKRSNKSGQFYLLATIVILVLIVGIFTITNYTQSIENIKVNNLEEELKIESWKILERGAITDDYPWDQFTQNFSVYAGKDVEIIYVLGDYQNRDVFYHDDLWTKVSAIGSESFNVATNISTVSYNEITKSFKFRSGENFYFIITQKIGGEIYVASNE